MDNFKTKMLSFLGTLVSIISIISVITFVLAGVITIFYTEVNTLFATMGWSQERMAWLTVSAGSLGTLGLVSTRLSGTLRSAIALAKVDNNAQIAVSTRLNDTKFATQQKINEQLRSQMQLNNDVNMKEMIATRLSIERQNEFNDLQAEKYVQAPDYLVNPDLKARYKAYLKKKE